MTSVEQRRMIQDLARYVRSMTRDERFAYDMMVKRVKDDEDLDALTLRMLEAMHANFVPRRSKDVLNDAWRKLTGGNDRKGSNE